LGRDILLVLAASHAPAIEILRRGGVLDQVSIAPTLDLAIIAGPPAGSPEPDPANVLTHPG